MREEGGIGLRDFQIVQLVSMIERACSVWIGGGIWDDWTNRCYVKNATMSTIWRCYNDSQNWRATLKAKEAIAKCVDLRHVCNVIWRGARMWPVLVNINDILWGRDSKDRRAGGLPKASMLF